MIGMHHLGPSLKKKKTASRQKGGLEVGGNNTTVEKTRGYGGKKAKEGGGKGLMAYLLPDELCWAWQVNLCEEHQGMGG